jgi:hypothetical protein
MTTATFSASGLVPLDWGGEASQRPRNQRSCGTSAVSVYSERVAKVLREAQRREAPNHLQRLFGSSYLTWTRAGWDGEGARPISSKTIANAANFLRMSSDYVDGVDITPEEDGYIQLEWFRAPDKVLSLSFGPSDVLSYSGLFGEGCSAYGAEKFTTEIPKSIWSLIERINQC